MFIHVTETIFRDAFHRAGRGNQFSYKALSALFEHLEELESHGGIELDVVALCCEYSEYESLKDFNDQNGTEYQSIEELEDDYDCFLIRVDCDDEDGRFITENS